MQEQDLLDEYKKYDFLNKEKAKIKILVSYIKPSFLFKSEILTPIHLGSAVEKEASKSGNVSLEDLAWLHKNCEFNDNFEGGISEYNRRIGFLTGTYWAWKNYEKLSNPEYFGSFGVRKFFAVDCLENLCDLDVILPLKRKLEYENNKEQFIKYHSENLCKSMVNIFSKIYPEEEKLFKRYLGLDFGYYHELYIMKKNIFFDFCFWIYPLVIALLNDDTCKVILFKEEESFSKCFLTHAVLEKRDIAFIVEILTGYFLFKLTCDKKIKYKECDYVIFEQADNKKDIKKMMSLLRKNIELKSRSDK